MKWGIMGPGNIVRRVSKSFAVTEGPEMFAIASRSEERAKAAAETYSAKRWYGSYEELVKDPDVEAVYVATPASMHCEHTCLALEHGKPVMCEKPFAVTEAEAKRMADCAGANNVFLMEAMWTRFLPHVAALRSVLERGEIGEVVHLAADHGQWFPFDPKHRLFNPDLAGGALLDLGVYPIAFAHDLLGVPESVQATGALTETGVDGQVSMVLKYPGNVQATLHTTLWAKTPTTAVISGTEGRIEVQGDFYAPTSFTVIRNDGTRWTFDREVEIGLQYEAAEVARQVAAGATESPRLTWDNSLAIMRTMDEVRAQIGLSYPGE